MKYKYFKYCKDIAKKSKYIKESGIDDDIFVNVIYLSNNPKFIKSKKLRNPNYSISSKNYISGIYIPDMEKNKFGFGDIDDDLLLFKFSDDNKSLEIYQIEEKKSFTNLLFEKFKNEDLF